MRLAFAVGFMVWLTVSIYSMNQNAYPATSGDVLAALPTRATRDNMNSDHTTFFNPQTAAVARAVSHKV